MKQKFEERTLEAWYASRGQELVSVLFLAVLLPLPASGVVAGAVEKADGFWAELIASALTFSVVIGIVAHMVSIHHHNRAIKKLGGVTKILASKKDSPPGTHLDALPVFYCGARESAEALQRTLRSFKRTSWLMRLCGISK